ncbi:MAG: glycosyltransferase family 4 protein [Anaerolineae bacterium]
MANSGGRPYRVLMIAPTSFFSDYGGHIRILEEATILQEMGHEVAIATYYKGSDMPGLTIRRTWRLPYHTDYEVGSSRHKLAFDVYLGVKALWEGLRFRPDVIHGHMHEGALIGGMAARLLRKPLVFDFQGSLTAEMVDHKFLDANGRVYPWAHRLERFITNRFPQAILTSSERAGQVLQEQFDVPASIIHPLPDCANPHRFDPNAKTAEEKLYIRRQIGIPDGRTIIAYLGLLTDYQGIPHLLQVAQKLMARGENTHMLIMGYPQVEHYQRMAQQLGVADRVTFTGKVEYRRAPALLSLGEISVTTKMSATEGSGKLLNYMAMAQPVVLYDSPVHREYLGDLGVYVERGDVDGFTTAVARLLHDPQRRACLGKKLRQRALTEFSWQRAGRKIEQVYRMLTS